MNIKGLFVIPLIVLVGMIVEMESASAQSFPTRPVRIVVPFPPGGAVDALGRILAARLNQKWNQPVVVENRPGGAAIIGTQEVAKAPADGATILLATTGHAINVALYENKLPYNPTRDFAAVSLAATAPNILVARPSLPADSVFDLVAYAKANPGKLNAGHPGIGTTMHLAMEVLRSATNTQFPIIGYKGSGPQITALLGKQIDVAFESPAALPHVRSGKLKALAVTSPKRAAILPEIPTLAEAGLHDINIVSWYGLVVRAGTPEAVLQQLSRDLNDAVKDTDARDRMTTFGLEPAGNMTSSEFDEFISVEIARWGKIVRRFGAKAE